MPLAGTPNSTVLSVIQRAWRRSLLVLIVEQFALAFALVCAGAILMLVLGTQILDWYWLVLLAVTGITLVSLRVRNRMTPQYAVAQLLDQRLQLSDSLSTAFFLRSGQHPYDVAAVNFQIDHAERVAASVQPSLAFPFTGRRLWALAGALAAVFFGLFAVRYLVTNSLNLRQSLIPLHLDDVLERVEHAFSPVGRKPPVGDDPGKQNAQAPSAADARNKVDRPDESQLKREQLQGGQPEGSQASPPTAQSQPQDAGHPSNEQQEKRAGDASNGQGQSSDKSDQQTGDPANQPEAKEQANNSRQNAPGMMDKMKDALSSLMAKIRPNASGQKAQSNDSNTAEDQKAGDQQSSSKNENSDSKQNSRDQQSAQEQSSQGQSQGQSAEKAQASQGHDSQQSADKKSSDSHSGIGRSDGDKDVQQAEQLRAMGKLAEIIGKRSASLTGDMMVENPSGKQQLKTEYSHVVGHHADLGGEINRDEIPLADQRYVREYMERVRKQAAETKEP